MKNALSLHWPEYAIEAAGLGLFMVSAGPRPGVVSAAGRALVSPSLVALPGAALGFREGFVVRDPDGHALRFRAQ